MTTVIITFEKLIDNLIAFKWNSNLKKFKKIFGEERSQGSHLWYKFNTYDKDVLWFYSSLDKNNSKLFMDYINKKKE